MLADVPVVASCPVLFRAKIWVWPPGFEALFLANNGPFSGKTHPDLAVDEVVEGFFWGGFGRQLSSLFADVQRSSGCQGHGPGGGSEVCGRCVLFD